MADNKSKWLRDLLVIPLVVGIIIAVISFGLPRLLDKGKELSYSIDGPTPSISRTGLGDITITVNGVSTPQIYTYRIRLWNSGREPLTNLPVRLVFTTQDVEFRVFSIGHATVPKFEFGAIREDDIDNKSKRFVYELLNSDSQDIVTLVTNSPADLELYSNSEGMRLREDRLRTPSRWISIAGSAASVAGLFAAFLALLFKEGLVRRIVYMLFGRRKA